MIDYDSHINARDIANYWAKGIVLLQHENSWSGYMVFSVDSSPSRTPGNETITLRLHSKELTSGNPPEEVKLSRPAFFKKAILHRPRLGVVQDDDGKMYMLSWVAAKSDMNKSIQSCDIVATPLETGLRSGGEELVLNSWADDNRKTGVAWTKAMEKLRRYRGLPDDCRGYHTLSALVWSQLTTKAPLIIDRAPPNRRLDGAPYGRRNLTLVIKYLNFKPVPLKVAYQRCLDRGSAVIHNTMWLRCKGKSSTVSIVNGESAIGTLSKTLQHHAVFDFKHPKISRINKQLLTMLLEEK